MKIAFLLSGLFICLLAGAQEKYTLSGYVKDSLSGETLIGASISVNGEGKGVNSNNYGFFSITLPKGEYGVIVSFVGYEPISGSIKLDQNTVFNFSLLPRGVAPSGLPPL